MNVFDLTRPETIYRYKALDNYTRAGGYFISWEWSDDLGALVYDLGDARYKTRPGLTRAAIVQAVIDAYLDRNPYGTPDVDRLAHLVGADLPDHLN